MVVVVFIGSGTGRRAVFLHKGRKICRDSLLNVKIGVIGLHCGGEKCRVAREVGLGWNVVAFSRSLELGGE